MTSFSCERKIFLLEQQTVFLKLNVKKKKKKLIHHNYFTYEDSFYLFPIDNHIRLLNSDMDYKLICQMEEEPEKHTFE